MPAVLQQENQRLAPNLARDGLVESSLRSSETQVIGLGAKGLPRNPQAGMHRGHADPRPHQYSLVARLLHEGCGDSVPQWTPEVR